MSFLALSFLKKNEKRKHTAHALVEKFRKTTYALTFLGVFFSTINGRRTKFTRPVPKNSRRRLHFFPKLTYTFLGGTGLRTTCSFHLFILWCYKP